MQQKKPRITKKAGNIESGVMIQNIVVRPVVRKSQDIQNWRNAIRAAEGIIPNRVLLYDLYYDILLDGTLHSIIDRRIKGVTKTPLIFLDAKGKEVEVMTALTRKRQFRNLRIEIGNRRKWGGSVCELSRNNGEFRVFTPERKNIRFDIGRVCYEQNGFDGYDYREPPYTNYVLEVGDSKDLGLLMSAAQYVIYKRGGFGDWAQFAEIFGIPFREARYDGYNDQVRKQLQMAMEEAGSASYMILPKDSEFKLHESKNTANNSSLYNDLRKACNEEMCILILGQTETTTASASSGYAQSKTHADVEASILEDDKEEELAILNEQVLPILANLGYPVEGGSFAYKISPEKLPKKDQADVIVKFKKEIGLPIDDEYIYQEFGIPKPKDYDKQKAQQNKPVDPPADTTDDEEEDVEDPPKKKDKKPMKKKAPAKLSAWDRLRLKLADFFDRAPFS